MINRALFIASLLPLFIGALIVTAIMADRQARPEPERIETVRYVTSEPEIETRIVYVERVVEVPVETVVVVTENVPQNVPLPPTEITREAAIPNVPQPVAPDQPAVVPPEPEPPLVIAVAVCERQGKGVGKQVGVCRKQGFP